MPPVLGPASPSKMRLKSRAGAIGTARTPSHSASNDSSSPTEKLLDTGGTRRHGRTAPVRLPRPVLLRRSGSRRRSLQRRVRLLGVLGDGDALAGGEPVGLDHHAGLASSLGGHSLLQRRHCSPAGGGHARRSIASLANAFEPSSWRRRRVGPKRRQPRSASASTSPPRAAPRGRRRQLDALVSDGGNEPGVCPRRRRPAPARPARSRRCPVRTATPVSGVTRERPHERVLATTAPTTRTLRSQRRDELVHADRRSVS